MDTTWLINGIIILGLIFASYTDLKKREVPDLLNYSLIAIGLILGLLGSIYTWSIWPFVSALSGFGVGYAFGALMFYTGQWGGGDAKMLMGIGTLQGFSIYRWYILGDFPLLLTTIVTILLAGSFYGIGYMFYLIFKNWKKFKKEWMKKLSQPFYFKFRLVVMTVVVLGILFSVLFVEDLFLRLSLIIFLGSLFIFVHVIFSVKIIEKVCMEKIIPVNKLTEGDWIVKDVFAKGKKICGPKDLGISLKQIALLKKLKIAKIKIKEGIPFIPGFLIGFVIVLILGNWLALLI